jgi:hypothetical protein
MSGERLCLSVCEARYRHLRRGILIVINDSRCSRRGQADQHTAEHVQVLVSTASTPWPTSRGRPAFWDQGRPARLRARPAYRVLFEGLAHPDRDTLDRRSDLCCPASSCPIPVMLAEK